VCPDFHTAGRTSDEASERFLGKLHVLGRQKIGYQVLLSCFLSTHPTTQSSGHTRAQLLRLLTALESGGQLHLPKGKKHWMPSEPSMPRWVRLSKPATPAGDATIWLPMLAFAAKNPDGPQRDALRCINAWLRECGPPRVRVPVRERSLEIFGNEKRLDELIQPDGSLFNGQLHVRDLGCFRVAVPLPYQTPDRAPNGASVLIVENHHTYWSLCEWNRESRHYAAVAYGAGNAFSSAAEHLDDIRQKTGGDALRYLGDIDSKGLEIPARTNRRRLKQGLTEIRPETRFYAWLLENGVRRQAKRPPTKEQIAIWRDWLTPKLRSPVQQLLQQGLWIPQESLGLAELEDFQ
jgi:hypothetical protein